MTSLNSQDPPHDRHAPNSGLPSKIDGAGNVHRRSVNEEASEHVADSKTDVCVRGLTMNDVAPIEAAKERFLQIVVDHFIAQDVVQVIDSEATQDEQDKPCKRKRNSGLVRYEGDAQFVLPLMYARNVYDTLVNEVDARLASLDVFQGMKIRVDVEATGGLFRMLANKFPEKGPYTFKRTQLATPAEIRTRFPELVDQEGKGEPFVVVNGLDIVEKPDTLSVADAEWFKRLTGRYEVSISAHDYKFYSPRQIYERVLSNPVTSGTDLPNEADVCISINEGDLDDPTILQQFITQANEYCYFERHRKATEPGFVTDLVFSHPAPLSLYRAFPYVLIIDALCKENRYKIPFFEVLGFTSTGEDFNLACAFISEEKEDNYLWVLNQISELCWFVGVTPKTIVTLTDPDQALFSAVEQAFPHTKHLLGRQQIYKNIEDRCLKDTCSNNMATAFEFVNVCKALFESKTKKVYEERLDLLKHDWKSKEGLIRYMKQTWLTPYKEKIVSAWTDNVLHFGTHTLTRVESSGSDKSVKQLLSSSDSLYSDFEYFWSELNATIKGQGVSILMSFDQLRENVPHECKRIDELMKYEVSHKAYEIMAQEYKCVRSGDKFPSTCMCQLRVSHGLPCAHEMEKYVANQTEIPLEAIHQFWWQLNLNVDVPDDPSSAARAFIVDLFIRFREMSLEEKMRCTYAVKKIIQSCEEPPTSITNNRFGDFFRKFFTCPWYSEPEFFSSEDNTPQMTPDAQPLFGISSSETSGQSCGSSTIPSSSGEGSSPSTNSMASEPYFKPPYIHESQKHVLPQIKAKNIYKDREFREEESGDLAILHQFLKRATQHYHFNRHRKAPGTNVVTDLVFANPGSLEVLRMFPYVLIINATCKENRYKIPFFEVLGMTSKWKRFNVACAFISAEREDNYVWVLNQISELCWFVGETPKTIVTMTNPNQTLFNSVEQAFPHTKHLLGRHLIYKNIEDRCLKDMCGNNIASNFVNACKKLFESKTENLYEERLASMENGWRSMQGLVRYLKQTWLTQYKDKIVSVWADKALHFGIHNMDRVEGPVEKCLSTTSNCSFDYLWMDLIVEIVSQNNEIKFPVDWSPPVHIPHKVKKIGIFNSLRWSSVSHEAYKIMVKEYKCVKSGDKYPTTCDCLLRDSYGLPCAHELAKCVADQTLVPIKAVHKFWRTNDLDFFPHNPSSRARAFVLDLFIRFREMTPSEQVRCEYAVNMIMQSDEAPTSLSKEDLSDDFLRKWFSSGWIPDYKCSLSEGNSSPDIPGTSMSISSCSSCSNSYATKFMPPFIHERLLKKPYENPAAYIPGKPLDNPYLKPAVYIPEKTSNDPYVEDPYICEIPNFMVPYVTDFCEYVANGHCGFEAIAAEGVENGWHWVRGDMFKEVATGSYVYANIFNYHTVETMLKALAVWTTPAYLPGQWFSIPDMGHIVASMYQLVFVVLGQQCITFLPLYVNVGTDLSDMDEICLVSLQHGSKFIKVTIDKGFPLPPAHPSWAHHHLRSADGLDQRYGDRFQKYKWFQSFMD